MAGQTGSASARSPVPDPRVPAHGPEDQGALEAQRAIAERPSISVSLRIGLSMLLCFMLVAGAVLATLARVSTVGASQEFIEKVSLYALEIEHARRFEKNYLLYGTNLDDALEQIQTAHQLLRSVRASMIELVGQGTFEKMEENLDQYGSLLERLGSFRRDGLQATLDDRPRVERDLRRHGAQVLADATELIDRERLRLRSAIGATSQIAGASLLSILLVMALIAYALTRQIAQPVRRFLDYTRRIADGDYSPITPVRRYRDEFSQLAIGLNMMLFRLKDRELQLARTSRMAAVGTLTAGIAHELNNPLNNIGLNAEALHDRLESYTDAQKRKLLGDILGQVERASATVRNLLDFTRVERPVFIPLAIADVVREAQRLVSNEAELGKVALNIEVPKDLPRVAGSPRDLQQVFLNLFLNAIQAMPEGGALSVRATAAAETIGIEVSDTGIGIPAENLGSVFDPFFTTKEVGSGTGLGLFVSYGILEKHKGTIVVRSKPGEGTTFSLTLPIAVTPAAGQRQ